MIVMEVRPRADGWMPAGCAALAIFGNALRIFSRRSRCP